MLRLVRFVGLIVQSILIEFIHVFGLVAFLFAAALGYFRFPSWLVVVVGVASGIIADKFIDQSEVVGLLERAAAANQRGGFLVIVYIIIVAVGYVSGAYARVWMIRRKAAATAPLPAAAPAAKEPRKRKRNGG